MHCRLHLNMVQMVHLCYVFSTLMFFPKVKKGEKEGKHVNLRHISDADAGLPLYCPHPDHLPPGEAKAGVGL